MYLHDVLYDPEIWQKLFSIISMIGLGFSFQFKSGHLSIYLDNTFYGNGFILNDFMVLDLDTSSFNASNSISYVASNCDDNSARWHARLGHHQAREDV